MSFVFISMNMSVSECGLSFCVCVCVCMHIHVLHQCYDCGGQRTTWGSQFTPLWQHKGSRDGTLLWASTLTKEPFQQPCSKHFKSHYTICEVGTSGELRREMLCPAPGRESTPAHWMSSSILPTWDLTSLGLLHAELLFILQLGYQTWSEGLGCYVEKTEKQKFDDVYFVKSRFIKKRVGMEVCVYHTCI